jgi:hypothetical protein
MLSVKPLQPSLTEPLKVIHNQRLLIALEGKVAVEQTHQLQPCQHFYIKTSTPCLVEFLCTPRE